MYDGKEMHQAEYLGEEACTTTESEILEGGWSSLANDY